MKGYGSFCPIAKAAEILAERWTLLVLRDILVGSRRFNDLRRGVPQMSPTLLSKRLKTLEDAGIVVRLPGSDSHTWEYHPTSACHELRPVIESIGHWGQRWVRSTLTRDELDAGMLMWYIHRHFVKKHLPPRRIVVYIEITDAIKRLKHWWLVLEAQEVDLCLEDPGHEVDITVITDLLSLTQVYIGDLALEHARSTGRMKISGPRALTQSMPSWFARSRFADDNPLSAA
ncbi:MAG: helix-turn-helix domain-containing protein [Lysobacterales bacterium]